MTNETATGQVLYHYRVLADHQQVWTYPTRGEAEAQRERLWERYPEMRVEVRRFVTR